MNRLRALLRDHVFDVRVLRHHLRELAVPALGEPDVAREQHVVEVRGVVGLARAASARRAGAARSASTPGSVVLTLWPRRLSAAPDRLPRVVEHQDAPPVPRIPQRRPGVDRSRRGCACSRCRRCPRSTARSSGCRGRSRGRGSAGPCSRGSAARSGPAGAAGPGRAGSASGSSTGTARRSRRCRPGSWRAAPRWCRRGPRSRGRRGAPRTSCIVSGAM